MTDRFNSLLPPNADASQKAVERATARIGDVPVPIADLWNPWECPRSVLPYLAWALSVDRWDPEWPESTRRATVAAALRVHRTKGTLGAVKDALAALGVTATVEEWFEYGGDPYRFCVEADLSDRGLTEREHANILATIRHAKNARSHLDQLTVSQSSRSETPRLASAMLVGVDVVVYPYAPPDPLLETQPAFMASIALGHTMTVNPPGAI